MTRYYSRMTPGLYWDWWLGTTRHPEGWRIVRLVRMTDEWAEIEVEDDGADSSLAGKTVLPWFQTTVDGGCVIVEREVMELEHNQVRVEQPELGTG